MANPLISDQINNQEQLNNILNDPNFINSILEIGRGMIVNDQNVNQERANGEDGEENEDGLPVLEQVNPARVNIPAFTEADETNITSLMNLGASRRDAMHYYVSCNYNVDLAANMIFDEQNN